MVVFSLSLTETSTPFVVTSVSQAPTHAPNPATQPPPGLTEEEIKTDMKVLARRRTKTWHSGRITEIKPSGKNTHNHWFIYILIVFVCNGIDMSIRLCLMYCNVCTELQTKCPHGDNNLFLSQVTLTYLVINLLLYQFMSFTEFFVFSMFSISQPLTLHREWKQV